jgi:outer membrane protein
MTSPSQQALMSSLATYGQWFAGLNASQLVYDFGESINRWKAARVAADAVEENGRTSQAQVDFNARSAFFTARAAKDLVGVARDTLANQEKHLGQVQGFVDVGTHPQIDLTQARADRATAQLQLITAENNYAVAKAMLNQAMGVERSVDYDLSDEEMPPVTGEDGDVEVLIGDAKQTRPEMASLRLTLKSQELGLRAARDQYWPALSLSGSVNDSGPYLDRTNWNFSGMVSLSVPLLQGGTIDAQIHQAQGQVTQAQAQLEIERLQVRLDVEQARLGIRAAKAAITAADDALANTRDRLRLAEGRYTTGVGSIIELGDAQVALTTAAAQKVSAEYQLYSTRAQLLKALGKSD